MSIESIKSINIENIRNDIKNRIDKAASQAVDVTGLSRTESRKKIEGSGGLVSFENLAEYKIALEIIGMPEEKIFETLNHENAHANTVEEQGAGFFAYELYVAKIDGTLSFLPSVRFYYPLDWSEEKINDIKRKVLHAPKDYGDTLSEEDIERLNKL